jgi:general secretion pathway protein C
MKRYLMIINLLLTTAVVFFSVDTFYKMAVARLDMTPSEDRLERQNIKVKTEAIPTQAHYTAITDRNLFNIKIEPSEAPKQGALKKVAVDELKKTDLKLKLWGTVAGNGGKTYAVIEDTAKRVQNLYRVGDTIQNAAVKVILREKVVLNVGDKDEVLSMEDIKSSGVPQKRLQSSQRQSRPRILPRQKIVLKKSDLLGALEDPEALMKQARMRPHFRDGVPDGLMLTGIRPNSIFRKMGLRNGDIIMGVDEEDIRSAEDAIKFYQGLGSSSQAKVQIKRRGRVRTLEYSIQ